MLYIITVVFDKKKSGCTSSNVWVIIKMMILWLRLILVVIGLTWNCICENHYVVKTVIVCLQFIYANVQFTILGLLRINSCELLLLLLSLEKCPRKLLNLSSWFITVIFFSVCVRECNALPTLLSITSGECSGTCKRRLKLQAAQANRFSFVT